MIDYMHHNNLTGTFLRRADIILQKTTTNRQKGHNIKNRFGSFQKIHFQEDALISSRNCAYFNLFRNVYSRNISQFKSPLTPCFFFFSLILWQELCLLGKTLRHLFCLASVCFCHFLCSMWTTSSSLKNNWLAVCEMLLTSAPYKQLLLMLKLWIHLVVHSSASGQK